MSIVAQITIKMGRVVETREIINIHKDFIPPINFRALFKYRTVILVEVFACYRPPRFDNKSKFFFVSILNKVNCEQEENYMIYYYTLHFNIKLLIIVCLLKLQEYSILVFFRI